MRHAKAAESLTETLIAINLAMESFEALRNLRDTNYLLFASDPDECWDKIEITDVADCSTATVTNIHHRWL